MPRTGNGIGTVHLGRTAQADDGSYVATLWVVFFFLPLVPLRSERLLLLSEFDNGFGHRNVRYTVLERVPRNWPQILRTYLAGWSVLAWYVSLWWVYAPVERLVGEKYQHWIPLVWVLLPFVVIFAWQRRFMPRPKLKPVEISPGSEFSVYRRDDAKKG